MFFTKKERISPIPEKWKDLEALLDAEFNSKYHWADDEVDRFEARLTTWLRAFEDYKAIAKDDEHDSLLDAVWSDYFKYWMLFLKQTLMLVNASIPSKSLPESFWIAVRDLESGAWREGDKD